MLDNRKKELLKILHDFQRYTSIDSLAKDLGVSEKTIRNDLKILDAFFNQDANLAIIRKPGAGVFMDASSVIKRSLRQELSCDLVLDTTLTQQETR